MPHLNEFDHVITDGATPVVCSKCGSLITDGPVERYGDMLLHVSCRRDILDELAREEFSEDDVEFAYQKHYGFGGCVVSLRRR